MNRLQLLLTKLAEEAAEVAQIALKTSQFGLDEVYQVETNAERIRKELDDVLGVVRMLNEEFDFGYDADERDYYIRAKELKVNEYAEYSKRLGMLSD